MVSSGWFVITCGVSFLAASGDDVLDLGSRRELFIDHHLIDRMTDVRLVLSRPRDEGVVIRFDQPWEYPFAGCPTVIRDGETYRLVYRGMFAPGDGTNVECTCYAESDDGVHWAKPSLGLFEVRGTRDNNVVLAHDPPFSHNFTPFLDGRPDAAPDARFKAVAGTGGSKGLCAFASPDAIHWRKLKDEPVITQGAFDSQNVAFWSEAEQAYLCYFRTFRNGKRWVSRTTSADFLAWTPPVEMSFRHGAAPAPDEHIYTNGTHPYFRAPHIYIAIPFRFMPGRRAISPQQATEIDVHPSYANDCSDAILMTSRGGDVYDRTFLESFIRPGLGPENWVSRTNMPALNVVQTGPEEMSVYLECNYAQPTVHLKRFSLRLDGFASARAGYAEGELLTKPIRFAGERLFVNFASSAAGGLRVEIQQPDGQPLPGFSLDAADEQVGNEIEREVSWAGSRDVSALAGTPVRLRFVMKDVDIYALRFGPAPVQPFNEGLYTFDTEAAPGPIVPVVADPGDRVRFRNGAQVLRDPALAASGDGCVQFAGDGSVRDLLVLRDTRQLGTAFTLAAQVAFEKSRWTRLFSNYRGHGPAAPGELAFSFDPSGVVVPGIVFTVKKTQIRSGKVELTPGRYHHLAATYADGQVRIYLDGETVGEGETPPGAVDLSSDLAMGEDYGGGPNEQLRGRVDDVLVLRRALGPGEIKVLARRQ